MASCTEHGEWERKYLACPKCFKDGDVNKPLGRGGDKWVRAYASLTKSLDLSDLADYDDELASEVKRLSKEAQEILDAPFIAPLSHVAATQDEHGNLIGWRAAVAKACGNADPVNPEGVESVVAAHVKHHVDGARPSSTAATFPVPIVLLRRMRNMCLRAVSDEYAEAKELVAELDAIQSAAPASATRDSIIEECAALLDAYGASHCRPQTAARRVRTLKSAASDGTTEGKP